MKFTDLLFAIVFGPAMSVGFVWNIAAEGFKWGRYRCDQFIDRQAARLAERERAAAAPPEGKEK